MIDPDRQKFEEVLPLYVNGSASGKQREFVENYIDKYPEAKAMLRLEMALMQAVKSAPPAFDKAKSQDLFLKSWKAEQKLKRPSEESIWTKLQRFRSNWGLSPAFAMVAAIAMVQGGLLLRIQSPSVAPVFRSVDTQDNIDQFMQHRESLRYIRMVPKSDSQYADLIDAVQVLFPVDEVRIESDGSLSIRSEHPGRYLEVKERLMSTGLFDDVMHVERVK